MVTAACGPTIFRGDAYGADFADSAFVCEPAGNLVKRVVLEEDLDKGTVRARDAYDDREFLTSTDERFRPVNALTGPDGCLWIVDMYRGILQHRIFVTTYLRKQILKRALDRPLGLGRIWRVVPQGFKQPKPPRLTEAPAKDLVAALAHPNGWWRTTAQRLLVEREDRSVVPLVREVARRDGRGRLHALWVLEALDALDTTSLLSALGDKDNRIREHGLRLSEAALSQGKHPAVRTRILSMENPSGGAVRRQLLHTLGQLGGNEMEAAMERVLRNNCETVSEQHAAVSGLYGRELPFLGRLLGEPAWRQPRRGRDALLRLLASCVTREERGERVRSLLAMAAASDVPWHRASILRGVADTRPRPPKKPRPLRLDEEPTELRELEASKHRATRDLATRIATFTTWPGKADWARLRLRPLNPQEKALFDRGRQFYAMVCRGCHQANGRGMDGLAPPLRASEWVTGPPSRLVRILVNGVGGPIEVAGKTYDLQMPGLPSFSDTEMAAVLTYIRRSFGHEADPIQPRTVTRQRTAIGNRTRAWTASELLEVK